MIDKDPQRQPQVAQWLSNLRAAVAKTVSASEALHARLEPVTLAPVAPREPLTRGTEPAPEQCGERSPEGPLAPLASGIREMVQQLDRLTDETEDILRRLEL